MSLSLNNIQGAKGSRKKRKRVGRGNASGHGTYSTRGLKGQKSRSGVSGLKKLGMRMTLLSTPKKRGFKSLRGKSQVVNLSNINNNFKEGSVITPKELLQKGLIDDIKTDVKILGEGELNVKNLEFRNVKISESARTQLEKMGGKINLKKIITQKKKSGALKAAKNKK